MHAPEAERLASQHVPGGGPVRLARLGTGLASATYRVERDGARYAMRIAQPGSREGFEPHWEAAVRALAGRAGLAPALVRAEPAAGVLVSAWVEGRCFDAGAAGEPRRIADVARLMRRIHALPPPRPARGADPADWIAGYERALAAAAPRGAGQAAALRAAADRRLALLARARGVHRVLCHSDLHPLNLVETGAGLVALDWEYAHVADPLWDAAGWCCMNDFTDAQRAALLESYLGRAPAAEERGRFDALVWVYDYVCLLWSEVFLRQGPGPADPGVVARAARLAARLGSGGSAAEDPAH